MNNQIIGLKLVDLEFKKDHRGFFFEFYRESKSLYEFSNQFNISQINLSVSRQNTFRGIHFNNSENFQHKLVTCLSGAILDFVVDLRIPSPTFGKVRKFYLHGQSSKAIFVPSGCGHGFLTYTDDTVVLYGQSSEYSPSHEHGLNYLDASLNISSEFPNNVLISEKDLNAPTLHELKKLNLLPKFSLCDYK
jgi:dTDP-4-dehydrorhamnose 3,5-epimerase